jgi:hypothetical protein
MSTTVTLEGFCEDAGYEFDMDIFILEPIRYHNFIGNAQGGIEDTVENYAIDYSLGDKWESDEEEFGSDGWGRIRKRFNQLKKADGKRKWAQYWKRVIEIDDNPDSDWVYRVLESHDGALA